MAGTQLEFKTSTPKKNAFQGAALQSRDDPSDRLGIEKNLLTMITDKKVKEKLLKVAQRKSALTVVVAGRSGVGKSTLMANLQMGLRDISTGQQYGERLLSRHSRSITTHTSEVQGFGAKLQVVSINSMVQKDDKFESSDGVDLLLYCVSLLPDSKINHVDQEIIKYLTANIGTDVWKNAILVLTFANVIKEIAPENTSVDLKRIAALYAKSFKEVLRGEVGNSFSVVTQFSSDELKTRESNEIVALPAGRDLTIQLPHRIKWGKIICSEMLKKCKHSAIPLLLEVQSPIYETLLMKVNEIILAIGIEDITGDIPAHDKSSRLDSTKGVDKDSTGAVLAARNTSDFANTGGTNNLASAPPLCANTQRESVKQEVLESQIEMRDGEALEISPIQSDNLDGEVNCKDELSAEALSEIPKNGYVCLKCAPYCLVYLPRDDTKSKVTNVEAICNDANYRKNEVPITPVVRISPPMTTFTLKKPAVIELIRSIRPIIDDDEQIVPMFSVSKPEAEWKKLSIENYEILKDRIAFKSTCFGLFAAVYKFQYPSATNRQNPRKIAIPVTASPPSEFEVNIPPQMNVEIKATLYYDSIHMCKESDPVATTSFTIEPIHFRFTEKVEIRTPIPDYITVKAEKQSDLELELWHSLEKPNEDANSDSEMKWTLVEDAKIDIVDSVAIFYTTHPGSYKLLWKSPMKLQNNQAKGLSRVWIKDQVKSIGCRWEIFMSQVSAVSESLYNCSIAVLIYPFQDAYKTLQHYRYSIYDSGAKPIPLIGHDLQCRLQLKNELFHHDSKHKKSYIESRLLSETSAVRIDFAFDFNDKQRIMSGSVFADLIISHSDQVQTCYLKIANDKSELNFQAETFTDSTSASSTNEPTVIIIPSLTSTERLSLSTLKEVQRSLWEVRYKWYQIGIELGIPIATLEVILQNNHRDIDKCFTSMLSEWLRNCHGDSPCWKTMAEALQSKPVAVHVQEPAKETTKSDVKSKLNQWEDNPIVGKAKKAADMVSKMNEFAQRMGNMPGDIDESEFTTMSHLLRQQSSEIVKYSTKVANLCSDETLKKNVGQGVERIERITKQLAQLVIAYSRVKKDEKLEGANMVVKTAEDLKKEIEVTVDATGKAYIRIRDRESIRNELDIEFKTMTT